MLDNLINKAGELKDEPYDSPLVKLWENKTINFLKENYGKDISEIFQQTQWPTKMATSDQEMQFMHIESMDKAVKFLNGLKDETPLSSNEKIAEASAEKSESAKKSQFGNITVSGGTVVFGDGNRINQVQIKDLVQALSEEIQEKVPESEDKRSILSSLKTLTENQSFASVTGAVIGEIIKKISQ